MHLLELAVQNVRGFTPAGRHPLKLGYVVLRGPTAEPPQIATLALALLYPEGRGGDVNRNRLFYLRDLKGKASRVNTQEDKA